MGYHRAGFEVEGVDIKPQSHYPFKFYLADALEFPLEGYDAYHASPPCQLWATGYNPYREKYPDYIDAIRQKLIRTNKHFVIENVLKSPLRRDLVICGCQVDLNHIRRQRVFEMSFNCPQLKGHDHRHLSITVTGTGTPTGTWRAWGRALKLSEFKKAMGIDWMARKELSEAIPPAYTEYIGKELIKYIK